MLDNCWGNKLDISIYSPQFTGLIYNNQLVNQSYSNIINVMVVDGCNSGQGVSIGSNCNNSQINATVRNVAGIGFYVAGASATYAPRGNRFKVNTFFCGTASVYESALFNQYEISSRHDGRTGAAGSSFAVDINGTYNQFTINLEDQPTPQVRGVVIRSGASNNNILDYKYNNNVQTFLNQDTSNTTGMPASWLLSKNSAVNTKIAATLQAGWSAAGGISGTAAPSYALDVTGAVWFFGAMTSGVGGVAFNLPAAYRPLVQVVLSTTSNSGAACSLAVQASGDVYVLFGSVTNVVLDGLSFPTQI